MLNKVFKYIETEEQAATLKFSADEQDAGYRLGGKGSTTIGTPDILWENIAFIQDKKIIWTHGEFYADTSAFSSLYKVRFLYADGTRNIETINHLVNECGRKNYSIVLDGEYYLESKGGGFSNNTGYERIIRIGTWEDSTQINLYIYTLHSKEANNEVRNDRWEISVFNIYGIVKSTILERESINYGFSNSEQLILGGQLKTINGNTIYQSGGGSITLKENVRGDWDESDSTSDSYILNKPDLSYYLLISDYEEDINAIDEALSYAISEHEKDIQAIDEAVSYAISEHENRLNEQEYTIGFALNDLHNDVTAIDEAVSYAISEHEKDINDIDEAVSYAISDHEDKINALTDDIDYLMDAIENIRGSIDLSSYVTKSELSEQSYLTSQDISELATESYVITKVADLVDSAPSTLNTLNELAAALGNDENFATTVATQIGEKVSKTELSGLGYITETQLSAQGYLTAVPNTYPTYTAIEAMGYITQSSLSSNSYAGYAYVYSAYSYILNIIKEDELVTSTAINDHNTRITALENAGYAGYAYVYSAYSYILDKLQNTGANVDLSTYVTKTELSEQSYLTEIPNTYATYAAIESMGYITMQDISAQSYLTEIPNTYATYAAITAMGYLTSQDITGLATESYVLTKVADLVDSAPGTLDTLNELATALGNDENFATTVASQISEKVSKTELSGLGYITTTDLSNQGYLTQSSLSENSYAGYAYVYSAYTYILNIINEDELVTSTALNDHNTRINETYSYVQSAYAYLLNEIYDNEYVTAYGLIQLNERIETLEENVGDVDFEQFALKATLNSYVTYNNAKKWYPSYSYVETYYTTYTYLDQRLSNIDLSTYVSKTELSSKSYITQTVLSNQSYITATQLDAQGYLTSIPNTYASYAAIEAMGYATYSYVQSAYSYILNAIVDNELVVAQTVSSLNNRVIILEEAGYVTGTQLSNQGYITQTALSNNSYAGYTYVYDSYAYIMGKINTLELATGGGGSGTTAEGGITAISFNGTAASITGSVASIVAPINDPTVQIQIDSATYSFTLNQSTGYTINLGSVIRSHQDLSTYVSKTELSNQSYLTSSSLTNYVTKTELSNAGYITSGLPSVTSSDNGKILMVVNGTWQLVSPATIYSGNATPSNANGNNGDIYIQS